MTLILDNVSISHLEILRLALQMPKLQILELVELEMLDSITLQEDDPNTGLEVAFQGLKELAIDEFTIEISHLLCSDVMRRAVESLEHLSLPIKNLPVTIPSLPVLCTLDLTLDL